MCVYVCRAVPGKRTLSTYLEEEFFFPRGCECMCVLRKGSQCEGSLVRLYACAGSNMSMARLCPGGVCCLPLPFACIRRVQGDQGQLSEEDFLERCSGNTVRSSAERDTDENTQVRTAHWWKRFHPLLWVLLFTECVFPIGLKC